MLRISVLLTGFLLFMSHIFEAQTTRDVSAELSADLQYSHPAIKLRWTRNDATNQYQVYKKEKNETS